MDLCSFVESLYSTDSLSDAFEVLEKDVELLGFEGVLYSYIPKGIVDQSLQPVYQVSKDYCPKYLEHYASARFDKNDALIKAVDNGEMQPIIWDGHIHDKYVGDDVRSKEVIETAKYYGMNSGITLPLMSGERGISGASFISSEKKRGFELLLDERLEQLTMRTRLFHNMVSANAHLSAEFIKPLIDSLSNTEKRFLMGLAAGKSPARIAVELNRTEKYLEQVMLKLRRKLSGVGPHDSPTLNRNQVLYYAGLWNLLEHS